MVGGWPLSGLFGDGASGRVFLADASTRTFFGGASARAAQRLVGDCRYAQFSVSAPCCWHTTERYDCPKESRVVVHEDTWKPTADAKITFREHAGRGFWRDGESWVANLDITRAPFVIEAEPRGLKNAEI